LANHIHNLYARNAPKSLFAINEFYPLAGLILMARSWCLEEESRVASFAYTSVGSRAIILPAAAGGR